MSRRVLLLLAGLGLVAVACGDDTAGETTSSSTPPEETSSTEVKEPCEDEAGGTFTEDQDLSGGTPGSPATAVEDIRFGAGASCERVVIDFGTGGPLTDPLPESDTIPAYGAIDETETVGRIRLDLPALEWAKVAHFSPGESELVTGVFVVRRPGANDAAGTVHIDILLRADVKWRTFELQNPGRLVVDLIGSEDAEIPSPVIAGEQTFVVLIGPRAGATVGTRFEIEGYARPFEASIALRVLQGDDAVVEHVTSTADYVSMYGDFSFTTTAPDGATTVEAIEQDAAGERPDVVASVTFEVSGTAEDAATTTSDTTAPAEATDTTQS